MGKYNKSNKKNIFIDKPEITVSEHEVVKNGRKLKMVIPEGKIGYGDVESHAQMAGDLATKHSDDTKAGQKAYEEVREHRDTEKGSTVYENRLRMAERKMRSRMSMMNMFNIVDPSSGKVIAQDILFMKTEKSGLQRPLKIRVDLATGETTEIPV
jgi:hypothetical protein|tara:strand:- start:70 stop:534 length:465 start_codon:yes stop_codon:yes gene_type:complete